MIMEDSAINHSSEKEALVLASKAAAATTESPEESGWTAYLEDLSQQSFVSSFGTPSMVSDAASFPAWKSSPHIDVNNDNHVLGASPNMPKKLTFKKTRAKEISHDDSLEDTASSPVNSPKVSDLRPLDMNLKKTNDHLHSSLGRGGSLEQYGGLEADEKCEHHQQMDLKNAKIINSTDLRKRGLCLVPMSVLVNYLG